MEYRLVLEAQDEGGYTVYAPALPGCVSEGETKEEAVMNIKEAISLYIETLKAHKQPIPSEKRISFTKVAIQA